MENDILSTYYDVSLNSVGKFVTSIGKWQIQSGSLFVFSTIINQQSKFVDGIRGYDYGNCEFADGI